MIYEIVETIHITTEQKRPVFIRNCRISKDSKLAMMQFLINLF